VLPNCLVWSPRRFFSSPSRGWFPAGGIASANDAGVLDRLGHLMLPMAVLAFVSLAVGSRTPRASAMIEILTQDYNPNGPRESLASCTVRSTTPFAAALARLITLAGFSFRLWSAGVE